MQIFEMLWLLITGSGCLVSGVLGVKYLLPMIFSQNLSRMTNNSIVEQQSHRSCRSKLKIRKLIHSFSRYRICLLKTKISTIYNQKIDILTTKFSRIWPKFIKIETGAAKNETSLIHSIIRILTHEQAA